LATNAQLEQEYKASRSVLLREMEVHRQYYEGIAERVAEMQARDMIMFQEVIQNVKNWVIADRKGVSDPDGGNHESIS
jgi:hypothetical protein